MFLVRYLRLVLIRNCLTAIREFVVSPLLVSRLSIPQYTRRRRELGIDEVAPGASPPLEHLSWSELRTHKILDTGISGVLAGGALLGWKSMLSYPVLIPLTNIRLLLQEGLELYCLGALRVAPQLYWFNWPTTNWESPE